MPAPAAARVKVTFTGNIGGSNFATSFWATVGGAAATPSGADMTALANALSGAWTTHMATPWARIADAATIVERCSVAYYASGSSSASAAGISSPIALPGGNAHTSAGSQAMVYSLYTAVSTRSGRGRMYWPATGGLPGGIMGYGFDTFDVNGNATGFAAFLHDVNTIIFLSTIRGLTACVFSDKNAAMYPITQVLVDARPDRVEHRERSMSFPRVAVAV